MSAALDIRTKYPMYLHLDPCPDIFDHPDDLDGLDYIVITMREDPEYDPEKEYDPAVGALLCFSQGEWNSQEKNWDWNVYWVGIADENGLVDIPALLQADPGLLRIVATRHNCKPALFWRDLN